MKYAFGFIGCGNMGGALASAAAQDADTKIAVTDFLREKADSMAARFDNVNSVSLEEVVFQSDYIFLAVKPQGLDALMKDLVSLLEKRTDTVLISMLAGTPIDKIGSYFKNDMPIIRIMPNTPASIGKGLILYSANQFVKEEQISVFTQKLSYAGILDPIDESKIDAASAVSGCGPAFCYLFAEALADGAVECGLPRDKAIRYAAAMLEGSASLILSSGKHPGELKDAVCSPGGTTIAGVHALEEHSFRAAAIDAVVSAYKRTLELK